METVTLERGNAGASVARAASEVYETNPIVKEREGVARAAALICRREPLGIIISSGRAKKCQNEEAMAAQRRRSNTKVWNSLRRSNTGSLVINAVTPA